MKTDVLNKRVSMLESRRPDVESERRREFLARLTIEELNTLHDIVERKEHGIEPTLEEKAFCYTLEAKYRNITEQNEVAR